jgi:hypothetical protein
MTDLDKAYLSLLESGLAAIRNGARNGDMDYCHMEAEHLHEIPSLIGETNVQRHVCYVTQARAAYLEWAATTDRPVVQELVQYFYAGPWKQIDQILGDQQVGRS